MLKLIHADLYKVFHRAYFYVLSLIVLGLSLVLIFGLHNSSAPFNSASSAIQLATECITYPILLLPCLTDIVMHEEYREHMVKNTLSYGTNRFLLYSAKVLTSVILGVIMMAVALIVYCGSASLILQHDAKFTPLLFREFFARLAAACVVYIACLAMAAFFSTLFSNNALWIFLFYVAFYMSDLLLKLFRLSGGIDYLLKIQVTNIIKNPVSQLTTPIAISLVTLAVFFVAGAVLFRRKDVC
jgi:hypothetical protein